ncbi:MAG: hypothetical protein VB093_16305 [Propionicimonas sp.]|nr:hypothetical protein [Propionicimonas sp.]
MPAAPRARRPRSDQVARVIQVLLFLILAASVVYTALHLAWAPETSTDPAIRVRADYVLMLLQCGGGLVVMFLPTIVHRQLGITVPSGMQIAFFVFLYAAIYLGEVRSFYYLFPFWDSILHFLSGIMLGTLGFYLVQLLNDAEPRKVNLSAAFVAFFAFCFGATCGVVWEIYEFSIDGLFGTNMQKVITDTGEVLVGRAALLDTMTDLILDTTAAALVALIGYINLRRAELAGRTPLGELVSLRPATSQPDATD